MRINILLLFLVPLSAFSFINIESLRKNSFEGFTKSAKLKFNSQSGNTDKVLSNISTLNSYVKDKNEYILIGDFRYGESFDQKDTEDGSLHFRFTRELEEPHHWEAYTQVEYDNFRALNFREVFGLGYRNEEKYFNAGAGAFFEHEEIEARTNQDAIRGNFYLSGTYQTDRGLEFSSIIYAQPSLKQSNDLRVILNTGISQKISDSVTINVEYEYTYDQRPPTAIKKYDSSLMFGFGLI